MIGQHIEQTLYDLALAIAGETEIERLTRNVLQRLLYHTGFAAGVLLRLDSEPEKRIVVEQLLGGRRCKDLVGKTLSWPTDTMQNGNAILPIDALPQDELCAAFKRMHHVLGLRASDRLRILAFTAELPPSVEKLVNVFDPVLMRFAHAYDLVARAELQKADLIKAKEEAEVANEAKSLFVANISHELRTPLNAILGMLYLALRNELPATLHNQLSKAQHSAQSLLDIINDVLDLSKIEAGKLELKRTEFGLGGVLERVTDVVASQASEKGSEEAFGSADRCGANGFLLKPISPSSLLDVMMSSLGREEVCNGHREVAHIQHTTARYDFAGLRLLLVEDNEINREFAGELLRGEDIEVDEAKDGEESVNMVQERKYDVVLMDIQMPVMDGLEATRRIRALGEMPGRERYATLPIIAMTALAMAQDIEKSEQAGMNDHITKPVDPDTLLQALAKWVSLPERTASSSIPPKEMPPPLIGLRHLDARDGLHRIGGKLEAYCRQLRRFRDHYAPAVTELRRLLDEEGIEAAEQYCHALKGVSGNIGAQSLFEQLDVVEAQLRRGKIPHPEDLDEVATRLHAVLGEIATLDTDEPCSAPTVLNADAPLDAEQISVLLLKLKRALEYDVGAADPPIRKLRRAVIGTAKQQAVEEIAKQVDVFDISSAVSRIDELQTEDGPEPTE